MTNHVIVLGGGSAGFIAALTLKKRLPKLNVTVLHSKELGIIGVGEGSTPLLPQHLHGYLGIEPGGFYREVRPIWKLGIHFEWGARPWFNYPFTKQYDSQYLQLSKSTGYYTDDAVHDLSLESSLMSVNRALPRQENGAPLLGLDLSYHLENETFVAYLDKTARSIGILVRDAMVRSVERNEAGVTGLRLDGDELVTADLYVDCSGFRSVLLGESLAEPFDSYADTLWCDRAVVGGWARSAQEPIQPYTVAETMNAGWCWRIDHEHRINRGYVYSSSYLSDADAEQEFRAKNPKIEKTRVVRFVTGAYRRSWVQNVVAIGNAAGFVEPLEATSLGVICNESQALVESLAEHPNGEVTPSIRREFNRNNERIWRSIRQFLAIHYKFNTRLDTPFWRDSREQIDILGAAEIVDYYRENGPSVLWRSTLLEDHDFFKVDGYLSLLVGQGVPHANRHVCSEQEKQVLAKIRAANHRKAMQGFTTEAALALVLSPQWQWNPEYYRRFYSLLKHL